MPQKILHAIFERRGRRRAAGARALHREIDNTLAKTAKHDIAAIARYRWANARLEQFLNGINGCLIRRFKKLAFILITVLFGRFIEQERIAAHEMFHDCAKDRWL